MDHSFLSRHPHPGVDPVARLRHVLDVYDGNVTDDRMAIDATLGVYGPGERTGLTFGDLRTIAKLIGA